MPSARRASTPIVYLDSCCFGSVVRRSPDLRNLNALQELLRDIDIGLLRFLGSSWLEYELRQARPVSAMRTLLSHVPSTDLFVPWDRSLGRDATRLVRALRLEQDSSAEMDCRHLACALRGGADFLITEDKAFYESMKQRILYIAPLRPALLRKWRQDVHGRE